MSPACRATARQASGAGGAPASSRRQSSDAESTTVENGEHIERPGAMLDS